MGDTADVVVVGAGVVGGAVAYLLAKEGLRVCLMDKEGIGSGASGHGQGSMSLAGKSFKPGPYFALGLASSRMCPAFVEAVKEDSGVDPLYHELPGLALALIEEEEQLFRQAMVWQREHVAMEWVGADECRRLEPRLTPDTLGAVRYHHAQVDGYRLTLAQARALERLGGSVLLREATGLLRQGGRVVGVAHPGGEISCDAIVLAMGAWAGVAREWLGFPVPVRPLHGELLHVRLPGGAPEVFVSTARHGSILPRRDGIVMVGSIGGASTSGMDLDVKYAFDPLDAGPWAFDLAPQEANRDFLLERVLRIMPAMEEATLVAHLAGVRPLSADRMPLIGPVPGCEGAYLAVGHGHKGIHLAPVTGRIVADLILGRATAWTELGEPFLPRRFAPLQAG